MKFSKMAAIWGTVAAAIAVGVHVINQLNLTVTGNAEVDAYLDSLDIKPSDETIRDIKDLVTDLKDDTSTDVILLCAKDMIANSVES